MENLSVVEKRLKLNGWVIMASTPFEIWHEDGQRMRGAAANWILENYGYPQEYVHSERFRQLSTAIKEFNSACAELKKYELLALSDEDKQEALESRVIAKSFLFGSKF